MLNIYTKMKMNLKFYIINIALSTRQKKNIEKKCVSTRDLSLLFMLKVIQGKLNTKFFIIKMLILMFID